MLRRQRRSSTPGAASAYSARKARAVENRTATAERRAARRDFVEAEQILAELREAEGQTYFNDPDGYRFTFGRRAPDVLTALSRSFAQELARSKLLSAFWPKPLFGRSLLS